MACARTAFLSIAIFAGCGAGTGAEVAAPPASSCPEAPVPAWHERLPRTTLRVAAIGEQDVVVAREVREPIRKCGERFFSAGDRDLFVSRLDAGGTHLWDRAFGGPGPDALASVDARDEAMVLAGTTAGGVDFGGGALGAGAFLARLDGSGEHVWSKAVPGAAVERARIDGDGNVVALVKASGRIDLGSGPVASPGGTLLAKLGPGGRPIWIKAYGPQVTMKDVAVTSGGVVVAVGSLRGSYDFGGGPVSTAPRDQDAIIVRYDASGSFSWSQRYGTEDDVQDGRVVVVGEPRQDIFTVLKEASGPVLAVHEYEPWGEPRWSVSLEGSTVLAADHAGDVLYGTVGESSGDATLGMLDERGRLVWERELSHVVGSEIEDITVTAAGLLVIAGSGGAGTDLGGGVILGPDAQGFVVGYPLGG